MCQSEKKSIFRITFSWVIICSFIYFISSWNICLVFLEKCKEFFHIFQLTKILVLLKMKGIFKKSNYSALFQFFNYTLYFYISLLLYLLCCIGNHKDSKYMCDSDQEWFLHLNIEYRNSCHPCPLKKNNNFWNYCGWTRVALWVIRDW